MQSIEAVVSRMRGNGDAVALFWNDIDYTYTEFFLLVDKWSERISENRIQAGTVCGFVGEYSPQVCSLIFALMRVKAILVPFTPLNENELPDYLGIASVECLFRFNVDDSWTFERLKVQNRNELIISFLARSVPGLIVFSSGSTGKPKGILQDCERVMHKFLEQRPCWRTVLFLMLDHFGGFNTLLSTFAYGGTGVCLPNRNPENVCRIIEKSRANLLPTTPTFLNLLIASRSYQKYDLSSIELITYGTEVMPSATLEAVRIIFPRAKIKQTYGLSELGVLRSQSEGDESVWVKIGGGGFETKIEDNVLWIRSESNMVGYLNAPNPFDKEGWMCTGDHVEVRGDYVRFLGRKSDMINVGGQKVFPAEIENILLQADNVQGASAFGSKHPIMGQVVVANVSLFRPEDPFQLSERLRSFCSERLVRYKVPVRFKIVNLDEQHSDRFKKIRQNNDVHSK